MDSRIVKMWINKEQLCTKCRNTRTKGFNKIQKKNSTGSKLLEKIIEGKEISNEDLIEVTAGRGKASLREKIPQIKQEISEKEYSMLTEDEQRFYQRDLTRFG